MHLGDGNGGEVVYELDGSDAAGTATVFVHGSARVVCEFLAGVDAEADQRALARLAELPHPNPASHLTSLYGELPPDQQEAAADVGEFAPCPAEADGARPLLLTQAAASLEDADTLAALDAAACLATAFFEGLAARH